MENKQLITKSCACCNNEFTTTNDRKQVCSVNCRVTLSRKKKRESLDLLCHYCGCKIEKKSYYMFCSDEHKKKYHKKKEWNTAIKIRIGKMIVSTKNFGGIPDMVRKFKLKASFNEFKDKTQGKKKMREMNTSIQFNGEHWKQRSLKENI